MDSRPSRGLMFKAHFDPIRLSVSLLCVLCALCGGLSAQDFKRLHPGVEHAQVEHKIGSDPVKINLLRLDLKKVRLDVHHALDRAVGLETTSSIAKRRGAVAAINAGFFRLDKSEFAGDAAGVLMIDGVLLSDSANDRIGLHFRNRKKYTSVFFNHIQSYASINIGRKGELRYLDLKGVNRERKRDDAVIFGPQFGATTGTSVNGIEIVLRRCREGKLIGSFRTVNCKRIEVNRDSANSEIPRDGYVISIEPDFRFEDQRVGEMIDESSRSEKRSIPISLRFLVFLDGGQFTVARTIDITNGVSRLIKNGVIELTWEKEKASRSFAETRHPRTAVAKLADGQFLMITVDGRQPGVSAGMSLPELAEYLLSLGAVDAMNLDGGGSTTMYLDGKVVNTPSDKEGERKIGDAIVVTLRK